jgi:hypothetical protein
LWWIVDIAKDECHAQLFVKAKANNVLGKRAGQASEPVKILHILYSISHNINNIGDIETKQITFSFAYPNSMFARTTLATSEWYSFRSTS